MGDDGAARWLGPTHGIMGTGRPITSGRPDPARSASIHDPSPTSPPHPATDVSGDQAIVKAVLDGDRDAFRRLVDRESAQVVRACHRVLGNLHDAEDAAQEAFVTAYRSLAGWRGDGPFGAWLTRIAVRIALRKAGQRRSVAWRDPFGAASSDVRDPITAAIDQASLAATAVTDPSSLTVRAERATDVRMAVARLPEPYREMVTLRFFGELTLAEIARETDRPLGTVKTQLHRGLARLRDALAAERER